MKERRVVDPALLARLSHLNFKARGVVEGVLTGLHRSPHHGSSVEFAQHREYEPGDDLRHIDWKAWARTDRYFVKQFEDETNLRAYLLLDTSGSMNYASTKGPTKSLYASQLAAGLAWLMLKQGDAVGLLPFGETLGRYVPPRARTDHFWNLADVIEDAPIGGATNVVGALSHIAELAHGRSVVMILSDFFDFNDRLAALCRQLQRRHQVIVFQVLDRAELDFPFRDLTIFEDLETDDRELADPRGMRDQYLAEIRAYCDGLRRNLREGGVAYHQVITDRPIERTVLDLLGGTA